MLSFYRWCKNARWASRAAGLAAEKEGLLKFLEAKEALHKEEASRVAGLAADLEQAEVMMEYLREGLRSARGVNKRLISERNHAKGELEMVLKGKAAELESALARQKAELEEKYVAELNDAVVEETGRLAADYKA